MSYKGRVYLSGAMSGIPELNFPAFAEAADLWRERGWAVISPAELGGNEELTWEWYMRQDMILIALYADAIAVLPDWHKSTGAQLEVGFAQALKLPIFDAETGNPVDIWREKRLSELTEKLEAGLEEIEGPPVRAGQIRDALKIANELFPTPFTLPGATTRPRHGFLLKEDGTLELTIWAIRDGKPLHQPVEFEDHEVINERELINVREKMRRKGFSF